MRVTLSTEAPRFVLDPGPRTIRRRASAALARRRAQLEQALTDARQAVWPFPLDGPFELDPLTDEDLL
ncbi:MAG: hypothetical protein AAGH15_10175 [Myxococcota bacterium]